MSATLLADNAVLKHIIEKNVAPANQKPFKDNLAQSYNKFYDDIEKLYKTPGGMARAIMHDFLETPKEEQLKKFTVLDELFENAIDKS